MSENTGALESRTHSLKSEAEAELQSLSYSVNNQSAKLVSELTVVIGELRKLQERYLAATKNSNVGSAAFCMAIEKTIDDLEKAQSAVNEGKSGMQKLLAKGLI